MEYVVLKESLDNNTWSVLVDTSTIFAINPIVDVYIVVQIPVIDQLDSNINSGSIEWNGNKKKINSFKSIIKSGSMNIINLHADKVTLSSVDSINIRVNYN